MDEIQDYYVLLGVSDNASLDEIKRAYTRKRREYQNDEDKSTQLNQAYDALCDSAKRKQYDLDMQYGNQVKDIKEKIKNSKTLEQRDKYLIEAKKIYLDILKKDAENADALWNLVEIEELLGSDAEVIQYLKKLEKCVDGDDKLLVYQRQGEIYRKIGNIDEAIKSYYAIYKADEAYTEAIKTLARLCYEDKKNIKAAIQILNDCINRSNDSKVKIVYLYETLRAVRLLNNSSYQKVEAVLYKKLQSFITEDRENNQANAAVILSCFNDILDREDFECLHRMEEIYQSFGVDNIELNKVFKALQEIANLMEKGKVHKVIGLYLEEQWTKEIKEQIGKLIINEAEQIKTSLEIIKKEAPEYWKSETELADLEKLVNEKLRVSKEFNLLSNDRTISYNMKKMMEYILLEDFVAFDDIKDEFVEVRDAFFEKEDKDKVQHTLRKMEEFYPLCFKIFADIFFDSESQDEPLKEQNKTGTGSQRRLPNFPNAAEGYEHKPYISGFLELLFIIIGTCCLPPILLVILIIKYYHRHQKSILKPLKRIFSIAISILIIAGIIMAVNYIREKQYEKNHDFILSDAELKKVEQLEEEYFRRTDINILYKQTEEQQIEIDGNYIALVYYENHAVWSKGYSIISNGLLTQEQLDELGSGIEELCNDDSLSDFERCEKYFQTVYSYITENEISEESYQEILDNQIEPNAYSISSDGVYIIGYDEGMILPGKYKVKAQGDIDNQFSLVYLTIDRDGRFMGRNTIGTQYVSFTFKEGDQLNISYNGKGQYNLILEEIVE